MSKDEVLKFVHKLESLKVCGIQVKPLSSKAPDLKDPKTYRWYIKFQVGKRKPASISPDLNGAEATALKKRYEQMGIKILEMWTTDSSPGMSLDHREKPAP